MVELKADAAGQGPRRHACAAEAGGIERRQVDTFGHIVLAAVNEAA
jgi:hypothetical protein